MNKKLSLLMAIAWISLAIAPSNAQQITIKPIPMNKNGIAFNQFPVLKERPDVVSWSVLSAVKSKVVNNQMQAIFTPEIKALHGKKQRIQGYMTPLEPGEKQTHFLITETSSSCQFCSSGGPESMVEVKAKTPIKYTMEAIVVEGTFAVLEGDPNGVYYSMSNAIGVK